MHWIPEKGDGRVDRLLFRHIGLALGAYRPLIACERGSAGSRGSTGSTGKVRRIKI